MSHLGQLRWGQDSITEKARLVNLQQLTIKFIPMLAHILAHILARLASLT